MLSCRLYSSIHSSIDLVCIYGVLPKFLLLLDISSKLFFFFLPFTEPTFRKVGMRDKNRCIKKLGADMCYEEKLRGVRE